MTLRCADSHVCNVLIRSGHRQQFIDLLSDPKATMEALLDRKKLKSLDGDRFQYRSSPYKILTFNIQPKVVFMAVWTGQELKIDFERCEIHGLGGLEKAVTFECSAMLTPLDSSIQARATAALALKSRHALTILPDAVLLSIGRKSLKLVFARLEKRCQKRLRKALIQL